MMSLQLANHQCQERSVSMSPAAQSSSLQNKQKKDATHGTFDSVDSESNPFLCVIEF